MCQRMALTTAVLAMALMVQGRHPGAALGMEPHPSMHPECCEHCGASVGAHHLVPCTIMVPMTVTETRMKTHVVKKTVEREETYTVFQRVPVHRKYTTEKCYLDDEVRTKTITEKKCRQVVNPVVKTCKVMVPHIESRQETVTREICTEDGLVRVEEPCTRQVTVLHEELRSKTYCVPDVVFDTTKREISYCVKVPKKRPVTCAEETVYKLVPIEKTRTVMACVPEVIKQPVEVQVCKMVPKTILCCVGCRQSLHGSRH